MFFRIRLLALWPTLIKNKVGEKVKCTKTGIKVQSFVTKSSDIECLIFFDPHIVFKSSILSDCRTFGLNRRVCSIYSIFFYVCNLRFATCWQKHSSRPFNLNLPSPNEIKFKTGKRNNNQEYWKTRARRWCTRNTQMNSFGLTRKGLSTKSGRTTQHAEPASCSRLRFTENKSDISPKTSISWSTT